MLLVSSVPTFATVKTGWQKVANSWKYYTDSQTAHTGWIRTESGWYYLNPEDATLKTGWLQTADGSWYFLNTVDGDSLGKMLTGWQRIDGYSYYFDNASGASEGRMMHGGTTPDGYTVNEHGQWTLNGVAQYSAQTGIITKKNNTGLTTVKRVSGGSGGGSGRSSTILATKSNADSAKKSDTNTASASNANPSTKNDPNAASDEVVKILNRELENARADVARAEEDAKAAETARMEAEKAVENARTDIAGANEAARLAEEARRLAEEAEREAKRALEDARRALEEAERANIDERSAKEAAESKLTALTEIEDASTAGLSRIEMLNKLNENQKTSAKSGIESLAIRTKNEVLSSRTKENVLTAKETGIRSINELADNAEILDTSKSVLETTIAEAESVKTNYRYLNAGAAPKNAFNDSLRAAKDKLANEDSPENIEEAARALREATNALDGVEETGNDVPQVETVRDYRPYSTRTVILQFVPSDATKVFIETITPLRSVGIAYSVKINDIPYTYNYRMRNDNEYNRHWGNYSNLPYQSALEFKDSAFQDGENTIEIKIDGYKTLRVTHTR